MARNVRTEREKKAVFMMDMSKACLKILTDPSLSLYLINRTSSVFSVNRVKESKSGAVAAATPAQDQEGRLERAKYLPCLCPLLRQRSLDSYLPLSNLLVCLL